MPRALRSPPVSTVSSKQRVMSSPDISNAVKETEKPNITSNNKRFRPDFSPETSKTTFKEFEDRIMNMLTAWKKDQDVLLNKINSDINDVKLQTKEIKKSNSEIEKSIEFINQAYENMRKCVEQLEKERLEQRTYIKELEKKIVDLQHSSRSSCLELRNIPHFDMESTSDLTSLMVQTCDALQVPVKATDLRDIYRIPGKKTSIRPIVAELVSVPLKNRIIEATRSFNNGRPSNDKLNTSHIGIKGNPKPVYIADHLPNSIRQLFYDTRKYASEHDYKFCWTQNHKIFLRKREGMAPNIITSVSCLTKLPKDK